ncbi:MAG: hypothetical protein EAZ27_03305 [Cytophagales bacterium]|nr:MAG: hypothetical protein EAZ27_03305 [Cytophagales bacterium]
MIIKNKINNGRIFFFLISTIWYFFIFYMTSNPSFSRYGTYYQIEKTISPIFKKDFNSKVNYSIIMVLNSSARILAHVFIFFIQSIFLIHFLYLLQLQKIHIIYITLLFILILGLFDEIHQSFVPDRQFSFWDVLKDIVGAILGIIFFWMTIKINIILKYFSK